MTKKDTFRDGILLKAKIFFIKLYPPSLLFNFYISKFLILLFLIYHWLMKINLFLSKFNVELLQVTPVLHMCYYLNNIADNISRRLI